MLFSPARLLSNPPPPVRHFSQERLCIKRVCLLGTMRTFDNFVIKSDLPGKTGGNLYQVSLPVN